MKISHDIRLSLISSTGRENAKSKQNGMAKGEISRRQKRSKTRGEIKLKRASASRQTRSNSRRKGEIIRRHQARRIIVAASAKMTSIRRKTKSEKALKIIVVAGGRQQ